MKAAVSRYGWIIVEPDGIRLQPAPQPANWQRTPDDWRRVALTMLDREYGYASGFEDGPVHDEAGLLAAIRRYPRVLRQDNAPLPPGLPAPEVLNGAG